MKEALTMRSIAEIWRFAFSKPDLDPPSPSPDELAKLFGAALISSGKYDDVGAAISAAWWAVPEFYRCRMEWAAIIAPTFWPHQFAMSPDEGSEATPAYVGQGEDKAIV